MNFHNMDEFSSQCRVFITAMTFINMIHLPRNDELLSKSGIFIKWGMLIKIMNFYQNYDFSSVWWIFITMKKLKWRISLLLMSWNQNYEVSLQRWIFITMMNFYHYFEFNYRAKFPPKSVLVPIEAELGLAQPQLVRRIFCST